MPEFDIDQFKSPSENKLEHKAKIIQYGSSPTIDIAQQNTVATKATVFILGISRDPYQWGNNSHPSRS